MATISWARTRDEEPQLLRSLARLAEVGFPVAVADRGTSPDFADGLRRLRGLRVTIPTERGLVAQVKASVALAATLESDFILYTEPDKEEFFAQRLAAFVRDAPDAGDIGVVLACRSSAALATFPAMQRHTEGVFNDLCGEVVGMPGDYSYGPFAMSRALLPHVATLTDDLGWGWRPSVFVAARRLGLQVVGIVDDHWCPMDQRQEDAAERAHRLRQLSQNLLGLI